MAGGASRRPARVLVVAGALLSLSLLLAACDQDLDDVEAAVGVTTVAVEDNRFAPRVIEVPLGTEVTWDWGGAGRDHNVVGAGFQSDVQRDGMFAHTFAQAGVYDYECTLHGGMTGRVIVRER